MSGPTVRRSVIVTNPEGFHMRPAARFVETVRDRKWQVHVCKGDQRADGGSVWSLLELGAVAGTELVVEVTGPGAEGAVATLVEIINMRFGDDTGISAPPDRNAPVDPDVLRQPPAP